MSDVQHLLQDHEQSDRVDTSDGRRAADAVRRPPGTVPLDTAAQVATASPSAQPRGVGGSLIDPPIDHPITTSVVSAVGGVVAVGGLAAGAAVGSAGGPLGAVVGAAVGAVVGGLAGRSVTHSIDPVLEDAYWSQHYTRRPYVEPGMSYEDYGPAYRYGLDIHRQYPGQHVDTLDRELADAWEQDARGRSRLSWDRARHAVHDAWGRVHNLSSSRDKA